MDKRSIKDLLQKWLSEGWLDDESYRESYMDGLRNAEEDEEHYKNNYHPHETEDGKQVHLKPWEHHLHHDENGHIWSLHPETGKARKKTTGITNIHDLNRMKSLAR